MIRTIACLFLFSCAIGHSQTTLDSLLKRTSISQPDTARARLYDLISWEYSRVNPDSGIKYGNMALQLSQDTKWKPGIAAAYSDLAMNNSALGRYSSALYLHEKALLIYQELGMVKSVAAVLANMGAEYERQGDYFSAQTYAQRALDIYEAENDSVNTPYVYETMGTVLFRQKNYTGAMDYYSKALSLHQRSGNKRRTTAVYGNMGMVLDGQGLYKQAIAHHRQALTVNSSLKNDYGKQVNLMNIGLVYCHMHQYDSALYFQRQALVISQLGGLKADMAVNYGNIGETFYFIATDSVIQPNRRAAIDSAIVYLNRALALSKEVEYYGPMLEFGNYLGLAYTLRGEYEDALRVFHEMKTIGDSITIAEQGIRIHDIETKRLLLIKEKELEIHDKQLRIAELEADNRNRQQFNYIFGIILLLLVLIAVIRIYIARIRKHRALLKDLAFMHSHELRSPVARMLGLVQLVKRSETDETTREIIGHIDTVSQEIDAVVRKATEQTTRKETGLLYRLRIYRRVSSAIFGADK